MFIEHYTALRQFNFMIFEYSNKQVTYVDWNKMVYNLENSCS